MRKLLLLLFFCVFPLKLVLGYSPEYNLERYDIQSTVRKVILKGKGHLEDKVARSPVFYPVEMFVNERMLYFNFLSKVLNVSLIVTNIYTTEIVYKENFSISTGAFFVDLSHEETGYYKVELVFETYDLLGEFDFQ